MNAPTWGGLPDRGEPVMNLDELTYERVTGADGRPMWLFSDGTLLPVVRGGSDDGGDAGTEGGDSGEGGDAGTGEGGENGDGGTGDGATTPTADEAKWKALARKHETESKKARAELDKLKASSQTDAEKAIEAAKGDGRKAAQAEFGQRLAGAEIKAALSGVVPDPAAIVEDLNLSKYVNDDGEVDSDAVEALRKKYEGLGAKGAKGSGTPDPLRQGNRGTAPDKGQVTHADLARMTPAQIVKARREGRLADLAKGVGRSGDYS